MKSYVLKWKKTAEKELNKISKEYINSITFKIESLLANPFPLNVRKIKGADSFFRIRVGDYRIIYQVKENENLIIINNIRHRKDAYKDF
ncbi:MAG: type II toxin-antitoxin system RelE/ParE family toxin [Bacteroidota bacterium]|nr:type II toxin-antitoxin system RelE/ParE family toxin [Bacteroidota bacterium]